jgi:hypothetical protein
MFALGRARPRHCLKIGVDHLAWAERSRTWNGRRRYRCLLSPTPPGSVKLSPIDLNLTDRVTLEERLRALAGPAQEVRFAGRVLVPELPRSIALLLPDLAARTAVLALDHVPHKKDEAEALIRWRLGQEQRLSLAGAKLIWQVFPAVQSGEKSHIVLAVAIQGNILAQYESVCESVGLLPQEVGVTSFHGFNLWLKAVGGYKPLRRDFAWLTVFDGGLTCFILHHGRPVFVRSKLLALESAGSADGRSGQIEDKIIRETAASFLACQELYPDVQVKDVALMADDGGSHIEEMLQDELGVVVDRLAWDHVDALGWNHGSGSTSMAALPVVAAMV